MEVKEEHLNIFRQIKRQFLEKTVVPEANNWKLRSNDEIWLCLFEQVIVVGNSEPVKKFRNDVFLKKQVSYEQLTNVESEDELKKKINYVLRAVGSRYASSDIRKCRKTNALAHNLKMLKLYRNGPKDLLGTLNDFKDPNPDLIKVEYLAKVLKYVKSKSARDLLMELGIVRNAVALDIRMLNILIKSGINVPKGFEANPKLYNEIEKDIIDKICNPLGISGVEFDRMLYQNYKSIMEMSFN